MTVTVVATAGASNANSYLTVAAADDLANLYLGTLNWAAASTDNKGRALIMASRYLDELSYVGTKASSSQSLLWPRTEAECGDWIFTSSEIPQPIKQATFDLAEYLLGDGDALSGKGAGNTELIPGIPNANLKRASVDVISVEFNSSTQADSKNALNVLPHLSKVLGCLCLSVAGSAYGSIRVQRS
jgi:hypothetical protein